ncbi:MAG: tetratricopeptide repeat protein [Thaumarchaeota archaeon]|nr:tetratricopeptide repeat protein [Nitrososphaerota archaeon]
MKSVFIIAIVAVAMIGVMVPSVFAELTDMQTISVDVDGTPYVISYSVTGITVTEIKSYTESYSLIFSVVVIDSGGILNVEFDRVFFDSIYNCVDDPFFILADGDQIAYDEIQTNSQSRTLSINISSGTEEIEIIGSVFGNSNEITCTYDPKLEPKPSLESFSINSENMMAIAATEEYRQACMEQYWIIKSYEYDYSVSLNDYNQAIQNYIWELRCDKTEKVWYTEPDFIGNKKINDSQELLEETEIVSHTVETAIGSYVPGCETSNACYLPQDITIRIGDAVQWNNVDTAPHTVTGVNPADDSSAVFDSNMLEMGNSYSFTFHDTGNYDYFCMVHPWMVGSVTVINNIAGFVDTSKDPQHYIDRYNNEPTYKEWFDENYPQYSSIYEAVGIEKLIEENTPKMTDKYDVAESNCTTYECQQSIMYQKINEYQNSGQSLMLEGGDSYNTSDKLVEIGYGEFDNGEYETAISTFRQVLLGTTNEQFRGESNLGMAWSYHKIGDFENAIPYYLKTLEWSGKTDEFRDAVKMDLSAAYLELKEYDKALEQMKGLENHENYDDYFTFAQNELAKINPSIQCGEGTIEKNGKCIVDTSNQKSSKGGGCLIATATYGSEMANEVQQLRELRDNQLLQTEFGTAFMGMFNDIYYSFSPIIADYERENPYFKEAVKLAITPMISSLSLMENAESESEVLGIGISVIMLNLGMYFGVPAVVVIGIRKRF